MTTGPDPLRVGFVGVGRMGAPMAGNLARAGFPVVLWNRDASKADRVAAHIGARTCATPRELATHCDVVVAMLADDAASEAVHLGEDGLLATEDGARYLVEMGTVSPAHISRLAAAAAPRHVIDAPVSGSIAAAEAGDLLIMAGADAAMLGPLDGVLSAMARDVVALGHCGAGATMKLAVNMIIHGLNQAVAEAVLLAERGGIAPADAYAVIERSAAAAPMIGYRKQQYLDERGSPVSFALSLAEKDLGLALDLCGELGVPAPQARVDHAQLGDARRAGFGARDMAAMLAYLRGDDR